MLHFTSDTHWFHRGSVSPPDPETGRSYGDRYKLWKGLPEMHAGMIERWNAHVDPDDEVYHIGDVTFRYGQPFLDLIDQLNFRKMTFLRGNHDSVKELRKTVAGYAREIDVVGHEATTVKLMRHGEKLYIELGHYAKRVWDKGHYGAWHLFGHSHGSMPPYSRSVDVGVDSPWITGKPEYRPYSLDEIETFMATRFYVSEDHHQPPDRRVIHAPVAGTANHT